MITRRQPCVPKPKKKKTNKEETKTKEEGGTDPVTMFGRVLIPSVLGGPVVTLIILPIQ